MVKKGDIVDIISPASSCTKEEISQIKNYITSIGFVPRILFEEDMILRSKLDGSFALTPSAIRFKQLYQALKNSDSKLIWCTKGGYGSGDLLPFLASAKSILQTKMFIGFSDITSISTFLQQSWGWQVVCGPMLIQMIDGGKLTVNKKSQQELLNLIFNKKNNLKYDLTALNNAKFSNIKAEIVGGCLSVLAGHFGGDFQIDFADKILFLEDVDESGEKLDRYFRQIVEVILKTKKKPKAILLGEFGYGIKDKIKQKNITHSFERFSSRIDEFKLNIPVFKTKIFLGHSDKMMPLILGGKSEVGQDKVLYQFCN